MGKSSGSDFNPQETAAAQGAANVQTAIAQARLNQINQTTPFGSINYSQTGDTFTVKDANGNDIEVPMFQSDVTLAPDQQQILDLQNALTKQGYQIGQGIAGQIASATGQPIDFSGLPAAPQANDAARTQVQDALYNRYTNMMDPRFEQDEQNLRTQLINSGHALGSQGYNQAMEDFRRDKNAAYEQALFGSVAGGGAEQSRLFGLESAARQNAIQELFAQRNAPINELAGILGTSGGVNVPQFGAPPQVGVAPTDVMGPAMYADQQSRADRQSTLGSIFGAVGTGLGAWLSDPEYKTDRAPAPPRAMLDMVKDMPNETWRYKGDPQRRVGPMAPEFAKRFGGRPDMIDGQQAFGVSVGAIKALADKVDKLERRVG